MKYKHMIMVYKFIRIVKIKIVDYIYKLEKK